MPRKGGTGTLIPASPERFGGGGVFAVQSMMCAKIRSHMLEKVNFGSLREPGGRCYRSGKLRFGAGAGSSELGPFARRGRLVVPQMASVYRVSRFGITLSCFHCHPALFSFVRDKGLKVAPQKGKQIQSQSKLLMHCVFFSPSTEISKHVLFCLYLHNY